jgi:hypothetical protein
MISSKRTRVRLTHSASDRELVAENSVNFYHWQQMVEKFAYVNMPHLSPASEVTYQCDGSLLIALCDVPSVLTYVFQMASAPH